jgi:hypothetical protein
MFFFIPSRSFIADVELYDNQAGMPDCFGRWATVEAVSYSGEVLRGENAGAPYVGVKLAFGANSTVSQSIVAGSMTRPACSPLTSAQTDELEQALAASVGVRRDWRGSAGVLLEAIAQADGSLLLRPYIVVTELTPVRSSRRSGVFVPGSGRIVFIDND